MSWKRSLSALCTAALLLSGGLLAAAPAQAAYATYGAIGAYYQAHTAALGAPTSTEHTGFSDRVQDFRNGSVYWSATTGAHWVHGGNLGEYKAQGGDSGKLGLPLTDEIKACCYGGIYQRFTGGIIYWATGAGSHAVHGAIGSLYARQTSEAALGYPTSDETAVRTQSGADIVTQSFQSSFITWNGTLNAVNTDPTHAHEIQLWQIRDKYMTTGGPFVHGNAVADQSVVDGDMVQHFLDGNLIVDSFLGTHVIPGPVFDFWQKNGGGYTMGQPTTDVYHVAGWPATVDFQAARVLFDPTCNPVSGCIQMIHYGYNMPPETPRTPTPTPTPTPSASPTDTATAVPTDTPTASPAAP
ncbi:LGFP repeat-containing protein [Arthrobacter oryzae]|uniref:LGFP repeat-containing protein n=1 Tax=Arthrobacter oryzae TaxID=409290 RepID=A0A495FLG8_9MICC|nr:hypothetical protein [Arthrobacter oryzae]RKR29812.1 LGFP repeat-containing protein [Arthrobacter oryzae]